MLGNLFPVNYPYPPNPERGRMRRSSIRITISRRGIGLSGLKGGGGSLGGTAQEPSATAAITTDTDRLYARSMS